MSQALVDALVDFHAVDYHALGLEGLGKPDGFISRQIEGWNRRWQNVKIEDIPEMESVYAWLVDNQPLSGKPSLVHNDFKLDNIMLDSSDPGLVVAVFDWDMCTLGDPLSDLGALLTYWTEPDDPPFMQAVAGRFMPVGDDRFLTRAQLVERYAARSGRDVSKIRFYHVLGLFRVAVIVAQIYFRFHRGQTQDQRFAAFGPMVPLLARVASEMMQAQ
jgi:aminoglycoside phosphotransferase (APT) family kinase protein